MKDSVNFDMTSKYSNIGCITGVISIPMDDADNLNTAHWYEHEKMRRPWPLTIMTTTITLVKSRVTM